MASPPASSPGQSDLNAGYVGLLLEQYLENPEAVDPAWRELFEHGDESVIAALPGLARLVETRADHDGNGGTARGAFASPCTDGAGAVTSLARRAARAGVSRLHCGTR